MIPLAPTTPRSVGAGAGRSALQLRPVAVGDARETLSPDDTSAVLSTVLDSREAAVWVMRPIRDGVGVVVDFECVVANRIVATLAEPEHETAVGRRVAEVMPDAVPELRTCVESAETGAPFVTEMEWNDERGERCGTATIHSVESGGDHLVVVVVDDTTTDRELRATIGEMRQRQRELEVQALHDPLTGLANRLLIDARLEHGISRLNRDTGSLAVMLLDLDGFKSVNDTYGHAAGDVVLRTVAHRLRAQARPYDTVGRLGGDEFVVVCEDLDDVANADSISRRVHSACRAPIAMAGGEVRLTASIGIALADSTDVDADILLASADSAMYRAKANSGDRTAYADVDIEERLHMRRDIDVGLRAAIERGDLVVDLAPIVRLADGARVGAQADVRWPHPELGDVDSTWLGDAALRLGLAASLVDRVVELAAHALAQSSPTGDAPQFVLVDVPGVVLHDAGFVDRVASVVRRRDLEPGSLCLAVDGTYVAQHLDDVRDVLLRLDEIGVGFVRDHLGAPDSPLVYFDDLAVSAVRFDTALTTAHEDPETRKLMELICEGMAAIGRISIAPHVGSTAHAVALRAIGMDLVQGPAVTDGLVL